VSEFFTVLSPTSHPPIRFNGNGSHFGEDGKSFGDDAKSNERIELTRQPTPLAKPFQAQPEATYFGLFLAGKSRFAFLKKD